MFVSSVSIKAAELEVGGSKAEIQFINNLDRFLHIAAGTRDAVEIQTSIAPGDYGVVLFYVDNHGLTTGEDVKLQADGDMYEFLEANVNGTHIVTVIDQDVFSLTLNNGGAKIQEIYPMIDEGNIPNISIQIAADVHKSYDLLDGDKLIVNGVPLTAKNEGNGFDGFAGQIRTNMNQSAEDLAIAVQEAIDCYIDLQGDGYEQLQNIRVERDGAKLIFISNSAEMLDIHIERQHELLPPKENIFDAKEATAKLPLYSNENGKEEYNIIKAIQDQEAQTKLNLTKNKYHKQEYIPQDPLFIALLGIERSREEMEIQTKDISNISTFGCKPEPQDLRSDSFWLRSEDIQGVGDVLLAQKQIKPQNFNFLPSINAQLKPHELGSVEQAIEQNLADNIPYLAMAINIGVRERLTGDYWIYYCHLRTSEGVKAYLLNPKTKFGLYATPMENLALRISEFYNNIPHNIECRNIGCQHDINSCGMWVLEFLKQTIELVPDPNALDFLENPLEQFSEIMNKICLVYAKKYINNPQKSCSYI